MRTAIFFTARETLLLQRSPRCALHQAPGRCLQSTSPDGELPTKQLVPGSADRLPVKYLLRKRRWVRGVPTSLNTVASASPGRYASTLFTRLSATSSFFCSYSATLSVCRREETLKPTGNTFQRPCEKAKAPQALTCTGGRAQSALLKAGVLLTGKGLHSLCSEAWHCRHEGREGRCAPSSCRSSRGRRRARCGCRWVTG